MLHDRLSKESLGELQQQIEDLQKSLQEQESKSERERVSMTWEYTKSSWIASICSVTVQNYVRAEQMVLTAGPCIVAVAVCVYGQGVAIYDIPCWLPVSKVSREAGRKLVTQGSLITTHAVLT